ncbi:DUF1127 domain-containing protein [Skermanella mucosa]|uniref:DUF1127 domain-containing protein n=1 Tax=Skermanella mucosa TaxID=1789672 RepID=UPI00192CBCA8|nr:DUF1127 domain-containing protein [Skermanella mucosa]UEM23832.1 DUF1127 domain-containing protein [Skermanella mucosa]
MTAYTTNSNELIQPTISGFRGSRPETAKPSEDRSIFARVSSLLYRYWTLYQTRAQLDRLSDRALSDIGIDRDGIPSVARRQHGGTLVRHSDLSTLLSMTDEDLADIGVCRGDLEDFRAGRIKYVRRRLVA